jgi:hypothetical protein
MKKALNLPVPENPEDPEDPNNENPVPEQPDKKNSETPVKFAEAAIETALTTTAAVSLAPGVVGAVAS